LNFQVFTGLIPPGFIARPAQWRWAATSGSALRLAALRIYGAVAVFGSSHFKTAK
jgi:hypothetical protein